MANNRIPEFKSQNQFQVTPEANLDTGLNAMFTAFQQFGKDVTAVDTSINKEVAKQQRLTLQYNIADAYQGFAEDASQINDPNGALESYQKAADSYHARLMGASGQFNKSFVNAYSRYYGNYYQHPLQKNKIAYDLRAEKIQDIDNNQQMFTQIQSEIDQSQPHIIEAQNPQGKTVKDDNGEPMLVNHQFDAARTLESQLIESYRQQAKDGKIPVSSLPKLIQDVHNQVNMAILNKGYEEHLKDGTEITYLREMIKHPIKGMSRGDALTLISKMFQTRQKFAKAMGLTESELTRRQKNQLKAIREEGALPNTELDHDTALLHPESHEAWMQEQARAKAVYDYRRMAYTQSPTVGQAILRHLTPDKNDPNFAEKIALRDSVAQAIKQDRDAYLKDPMKFEKNNQSWVDQKRQWDIVHNNNQRKPNQPDSPINLHVSNPYVDAMERQRLNGIKNPKPIDNSESSAIINQLDTMNGHQKMAYFKQWRDYFDNDHVYNAFVNQLHQDGMSATAGLLASFDPMDKDANHVAEALNIPNKDLTAEMKAKDVNNTQLKVMNKLINNAVWNQSGNRQFVSYMQAQRAYAGGADNNFQQQMQSTLENLSYYYYLNNIETNPKHAVDRAMQNIMGRWTVATVRRHPTLIPKQYSEDAVKDYSNHFLNKNFNDFDFVLTRTTQGGQLPESAAADIDRQNVKTGHWALNNTNDGWVWVDRNGILRRNKKGESFGFSFDEAVNDYQQRHPIGERVTTALEKHTFNALSALVPMGQEVKRSSDVARNLINTLSGEMDET